ncbi:MAG: carboxypeptidase regulatory-like domain-containing protein [Planctomycetia bacterium]|nr:carboxypeptidase regulatory-like domain-containing protein [Planctomycetia bacterium]
MLKETGTNTGVFTSNAGTQSVTYPVGTTSGYVEDFNTGSHNFPALGSSITGLNLKHLSANTGGNAGSALNGEITVESGDTLELLYAGSTLDTASVKTNSGVIVFSPSSVSAVDADSLTNANVIITITDPDENLNPVARDVIGFADGSVLLSGSPGTGSSRVQLSAIDQTTGTTLSIGGTQVIASNIMLVENGNNTGVFVASGKVFGSTTATVNGNVIIGTSTSSTYTGGNITLGSSPAATFKIIETNASGKIGLYFADTNLPVLGFVSPSSKSFPGTSSLSLSSVVALGKNTSLFGELADDNQGTSSSGLIKLIDGTNYCLVAIDSLDTSGTADAGSITASATISLDSFQLAGPRKGDTLRVSYLDELNNGGISGTVTGTAAYGVSGVTGTVAQDNSAPDINDYLTVTVVDENLNTSTSTKESVSASGSLWNGTTTNNRGDILKVKSYSSKTIGVSHPDGSGVGTQSVRISNTDNSFVWVVPTSAGTFSDPLSSGVTTFSLGTETVSAIPLVKGVSADADSFLSSANTSSFVATLDGTNNSVEISPDGTRWVSVPIYETGANSSTFVGTVGFDYTAVRLTTNTSKSITTLISDFTGTSSILFDGTLDTSASNVIGTGSVVRILDGSSQEFAEVCSVGTSSVSVTKLANSTAFIPSRTWVQVIGNDMARLDTLTDGTVISRIGGICNGTYRVRYNDALGSGNVYMAGNTLAVTASNFGFVTYDATLSTNVTGNTGPDTFIVATLVDQDLNTSVGSIQTTSEDDNASGKKISNQDGLGVPSVASGSNTTFINGGTSKIIYASTLGSLGSSSLDIGVNTIDFPLTETAKNSGTFKGSFQLSSSSSTSNGGNILKVSNGDSVFVSYIDGPNGSCDTFNVVTDPISIVTELGVLSLSKDSAYLSGDTIVASVVDSDRNTTGAADTLTTAIKVSGANYDIGDDVYLNLTETGVNTGSFVATFTTSGIVNTSGSAIKTIQGGILNVVYTDNKPQNTTATKQLGLSSCDAEMAFDADAFGLNSFATLTLSDCERNSNSSNAQTLLNDVFITSSSGANTKVRMAETGNDTGVFTGSIKLVSTSGTVEFSQIQVAVGDTLTISYFDTITVDGTTKQVTDTATVSDVVVGNITGRVTNSVTGVGINGASVTVQGTGLQGTTGNIQGQDGIYVIQNVPTGAQTLAVAANGFASTTKGVTVEAGNPNPQTGANIFNFALVVTGETPTPTGSPTPTPTPEVGNIAGQVTDADTGAGINGAKVTVVGTGLSGTTASVQGQDGVYAIPNVPVGAQTLVSEAAGYVSSAQDVTVAAGNPDPQTGANIFRFALNTEGTPTPTPTPTPEPCVPVKMKASPKPLKIVKETSAEETITVFCGDNSGSVNRLVQATITGGKNRITVSPASVLTDANGEAKFTITALSKTGNAKVKFEDAGRKKVKVNVSVRIKNK